MDDLDRQLLLFLQNGIPLCKRPFEGIGARLGIDSADVLLRISRLKIKKIISQITAVLEGRHLGYENALAAMIVLPEQFEKAVSGMKSHPGVTSCSVRRDEFNLWFTLAVPGGKTEKHLRELHRFAGAKKTILLPVLKRFKGASGCDFSGFPEKEIKPASLNPAETDLIRIIQENFPLDDEPFRKWAEEMGTSESEVFGLLEAWSRKGYFKKIAAVVPSKTAAAENTVLTVWEVPEERQDEAGNSMAAFAEIIDCVKRPAYPEFPYALYSLVRAEGPDQAEEILGKVSSVVGGWPRRLLWNVKEHKKIRLKYFSEGLEDWQSRALEIQSSGSKSSSNEE